MNPLIQALSFLTEFILGFLIFVFLLRFLCQLGSHRGGDQIVHMLGKVTQPIIKPLSTVLPRWRSWDIPALFCAYFTMLIKIVILLFLQGGFLLSFLYLPILALGLLLGQITFILFYAILIAVIISWLLPFSRNPLVDFIYLLSEPLLQEIRKYLPSTWGIDISPLIAMVALKLIDILVVNPLIGAFF